MASKKKAKKAVKKSSPKLDKAKKVAMKQLAVAKKKFQAAERQVKVYVHKNPEKAALIAAGAGAAIGAALGVLIGRKLKK
ncbi:MAG: hypothetical protein KJ574_05225 [Nanoarchaeota archaeon]|nr:hypothetical protein [Nanoarchaeota archaeon]